MVPTHHTHQIFSSRYIYFQRYRILKSRLFRFFPQIVFLALFVHFISLQQHLPSDLSLGAGSTTYCGDSFLNIQIGKFCCMETRLAKTLLKCNVGQSLAAFKSMQQSLHIYYSAGYISPACRLTEMQLHKIQKMKENDKNGITPLLKPQCSVFPQNLELLSSVKGLCYHNTKRYIWDNDMLNLISIGLKFLFWP